MFTRCGLLVTLALSAGCGGEQRPEPAIAIPPAAASAASDADAKPKKVQPGEAGEIRAQVMRRLGDVRRCFEDLLGRVPGSEGKFVVRWHIEPDGSVSDVRVVDATLGDGQFTRCIVAVFSTMQYSSGPADASWGFGLKPPQ